MSKVTPIKQQQEAAVDKAIEKNIGAQLRGTRELDIGDGKEYTVFFSVNAMIDLQREYGSLQKLFSEFEKGMEMDFNVFLDFIHAGLKSKNKGITKEYLGDTIDFFAFGDILPQLMGTAQDAMPSDQEGSTE